MRLQKLPEKAIGTCGRFPHDVRLLSMKKRRRLPANERFRSAPTDPRYETRKCPGSGQPYLVSFPLATATCIRQKMNTNFSPFKSGLTDTPGSHGRRCVFDAIDMLWLVLRNIV